MIVDLTQAKCKNCHKIVKPQLQTGGNERIGCPLCGNSKAYSAATPGPRLNKLRQETVTELFEEMK